MMLEGGLGSRIGVWLALLIVACFLLRLAAAWPGLAKAEATFFRPDSELYYGMARSLLQEGRLAEAPGVARLATARTPGYPLFLAGLLALFGRSVEGVVFAQLLISALTVVPIVLCGRILGGARAGWIAGGLWGLNITSIAAAPMILSDTLYTHFTAWQVYAFLRFWRRGSGAALGVSILMNALGTLIRPAGLFWVVPMAVIIMVQTRWGLWRRLLAVACGLLLTAAIWTPWMLRNARLGAGFRLETTIGTFLYYYNAAAVMAGVTGESSTAIAERWMAEDERLFAEEPNRFADEASRVDHQVRQGLAIFKRHPVRWLLRYANPLILLPDVPTFLENLGLTQTGQGTLGVLNSEGLLAAVRHYFAGRYFGLAMTVPLLLVVAVGYLLCGWQLVRWLFQWRWDGLLLFAGLALYFLVLSSPAPAPRYQLPALPMLLAVAGTAASKQVSVADDKVEA
jgi:4-amino-4-deoxy-L-arabinose transferase-like glycosyltransferase